MEKESPKKPRLSLTRQNNHKPDNPTRRLSLRAHNPSNSGASSSKSQPVRRSNLNETPNRGESSAKQQRHIRNAPSRNGADNETEEEDSEGEEENKKRRRRTLKQGESPCALCKVEQQPKDEPLMECMKCKAKYHIKKCLRYKDEIEFNLRASSKLICPRCILCAACDTFITDPSNVECSSCCRAWHGACAPPGHRTTQNFDSPWFCARCCRIKHFRDLNSPKPSIEIKMANPKTRKQKKEVREKLEFDVDVGEIEELCNKRDYTMDFLRYESGFSSKEPNPVLLVKNKKDKRRKSGNEDYDYSKPVRGKNFPINVRKDVEMYEQSRREAYLPRPSTSARSDGQYLHFGDGKACKTLYRSAYDEPLQSSPNIYACKFCLYTAPEQEDLVAHWNQCIVSHPPGNEIYREDDLSFFEVEGILQPRYCRDLCLISKLFIASKTLYQEVETFTFYVLCERTPEGYVIVGYFSKERHPSKNNNLSCLLVFPTVQKKGYGRLLIDMSYELSRMEHRIGHPEHPLSDLGILAYRGYWRSSLLCYLRNHRKSDRISIKDICLATRIDQTDIVNQLMLDNIVNIKQGTYNIKLARRAMKYPLSQFRRRCIDPTKLVWKPKPNRIPLDPTKINLYSSD